MTRGVTERWKLYFNPRSREGSDTNQSGFNYLDKLFQSTLPRRERRKRFEKVCTRQSNFNPRSREGSDEELQVLHKAERNFNPRSREGSDSQQRITSQHCGISIHAPAKGATFFSFLICHTTNISIHAPAKGATESGYL